MIEIDEKELVPFFKEVYFTYDYDFSNYKLGTLKRRIQNHAIEESIKSFEEYKKRVLNQKTFFEKMFKYFSINVTEFFREPKSLRTIRKKVIPYLSTYSHIKIWYVGCSTGENAYSLAIMLDELNLLNKTQIYATDFNNEVLKKAKKGVYKLENIEENVQNYKKYGGAFCLDKYYTKVDEGHIEMKDYLKDKILFFHHNLVTDGVMNEFNLVFCQNVLIYFDEVLKNRVVKLFSQSLRINGFMMIGESEYISKESMGDFNEYTSEMKVYQKCK